ncbi:hypothetical protein BDV25DRAFT_135716 [Aspergillus avenaceus]|uniref:PAN-3 domain-containing protein n=1 Tax=Aspergillus avenaceus TaxID=36643 RepID=A0A5N6U7G7_ASPAV|nr:hypothetical protein BDV25DRAFT_135716 [Aspergillus avenaceus]
MRNAASWTWRAGPHRLQLDQYFRKNYKGAFRSRGVLVRNADAAHSSVRSRRGNHSWKRLLFQLALADFAAFCPSKDSQPATIDNTDYTVTCEKSYISPIPINVLGNATPEDCARHCTSETTCVAIIWDQGNCWQFDSAPTGPISATGAIAMKPGVKTVPPTCQDTLQQCEADKQQALSDKQASDLSLAECEKRYTDALGPHHNCAKDNEIVTASNGKRYSARCKRGTGTGSVVISPMKSYIARQGCIDDCSRTTSCTAVQYSAALRQCHRYSNIGINYGSNTHYDAYLAI